MARRGGKNWKSFSSPTDDKGSLYSDYVDRDRDRDRDWDRDRKRDGGVKYNNQRRVSFKLKGRVANRISKVAISKLEGDEEMSEHVNFNNSFNKKDKPKRVGSPIPFKFGNPLGWYQVMIPYGQKYDKKVITYLILEKIAPDRFEPLYYKEESSRVVFYLDDSKVAEKLKNLDKRILMPDGYKLIIKVRSAIPTVHMDDALKERMKLVMSKRYNAQTKALDLSKFHTDEDLKGVFCGLLRPAVMIAAINIMAENIPDLEALNLNDNLIMQCDQFKYMAEKLPCLKILYLDGNRINSASQLNALRGMQLVELAIKRNPFMKNYRIETAYISDMQKKFPKLRKLDGQDLKPIIGFDVMDRSELPTARQSFLIDTSGADVVRQFIQKYFEIFDSNNRQPLIHGYHEHAMLSLSSATNQSRLSHYAPYCRNLKSYDQKIKNRPIRQGKLPCISLLIELPKTQHDLQSFTVDLTLYTPKMIAFTVTGVFKELSEYPSSSKETNMRSFQRSFFIVPMGEGFCIRNELILITHVTSNQLRTAFKPIEPAQTTSPSSAPSAPSTSNHTPSTPLNMPATSAPDDSIKLQMVQAMAEQSNMNLEWSRRCLEETNWDFNHALYAFAEVQKQNKIPPEAFIK